VHYDPAKPHVALNFAETLDGVDFVRGDVRDAQTVRDALRGIVLSALAGR
jgi:hypothetical protein